MQIRGLARFIAMIVRGGKFRNAGVDFSERRKAALADLQPFCPPDKDAQHHSPHLPRLLPPWLNFWMGQTAFIRQSLRSETRHLRLPQSLLCYVRNPRVASTAISYALLKVRFPDLTAMNLTPEKLNFLIDAHLEKKLIPEQANDTFFTVVRNPFARLVSFYRNFFEQPQEAFIYEDYLFGIFRKNQTFKEFVRTLNTIPVALLDQHIKPQHRLLQPYREKKVELMIFKLEEPTAFLNFISPYGLSLETINAGMYVDDYRRYYDEETLDIASRLYAGDLEMFGYDHFLAGR